MLDRWVGRIVVLLPAIGLLAGCKLIDQNTFAPSPEAKPVAAAPAPTPAQVDSRRALVTIDYAGGTPDYRPMLHYAVQAAKARDRNVQFDVIAVLPDLSDAPAGQHEANAVMHAIMTDGVPASHIHLGLRAVPGVKNRQVRVYVR